MKRIDELKSIRDDLEIYAAQCDRVARQKTSHVHFDKNIYGMFGNLDARDARNIARGITFALSGLDDGIDHGPRSVTIKELIVLHCKAEGPVGFYSIQNYVNSQFPTYVCAYDIDRVLDELEQAGAIEKYDYNHWC